MLKGGGREKAAIFNLGKILVLYTHCPQLSLQECDMQTPNITACN